MARNITTTNLKGLAMFGLTWKDLGVGVAIAAAGAAVDETVRYGIDVYDYHYGSGPKRRKEARARREAAEKAAKTRKRNAKKAAAPATKGYKVKRVA